MGPLQGSVQCFGCLTFLRRDARAKAESAPLNDASPPDKATDAKDEHRKSDQFKPIREARKSRDAAKDIPAQVRAMMMPKDWTKEPGAENGAAVRSRSMNEIKDAEQAALSMLATFSKQLLDGDFSAAAANFKKSGRYIDLYQQTVTGPDEIRKVLEEVKSENESHWKANPHCGFERAVDVLLPTGVRHEAVQTAFVEHSDDMQEQKILRMVVKPKHAAVACVLAFTKARENYDTSGMLEHMTKDISWRTWHGFEFYGKDAVRKMLEDQNRRQEERTGITDFALEHITSDGTVFKRVVLIQRDGFDVHAEQTIRVVNQLAKMPPVVISKDIQREVHGTLPRIKEVELHEVEQDQYGEWVRRASPK